MKALPKGQYSKHFRDGLGVITESGEQRTFIDLDIYEIHAAAQEIGVHIALGVARKNVLSMILRETLGLTSVGIAMGLACALAASQLVANMLYGICAQDPVTLAVVSVVLTTVAAHAGWIPARRAIRVDPMVALHYE